MIQIAAAILQIELNKAVVRFGTGAVSGEAALSAVGIVLRISTVVISICVGIGVGIQPIIGFNQGAGLGGRVKETFRKAVGVATAVSVVGWLGCVLLPAQILRLFGMSDPAYLEFGIRCMRVFSAGYARGRLPGCVLPVLSGDRAGRQSPAALYPPPAPADGSSYPYFLPSLGNGRHFIRKPHGRLSDYADGCAAAVA